jgi:hypothetical protein
MLAMSARTYATVSQPWHVSQPGVDDTSGRIMRPRIVAAERELLKIQSAGCIPKAAGTGTWAGLG